VVQALFYGIGPAVISIIAISAFRLARATVERDVRLWFIFCAIAAITFLSRTEIALLFVVAGIIGIFIYAPFWKNSTDASTQPIIFVGPRLHKSASRVWDSWVPSLSRQERSRSGAVWPSYPSSIKVSFSTTGG